jgi:hypothetical protein
METLLAVAAGTPVLTGIIDQQAFHFEIAGYASAVGLSAWSCDIAIDMGSSVSTIGSRCIGNLFNGMAVRTGGEQYGTARWQGGVD